MGNLPSRSSGGLVGSLPSSYRGRGGGLVGSLPSSYRKRGRASWVLSPALIEGGFNS